MKRKSPRINKTIIVRRKKSAMEDHAELIKITKLERDKLQEELNNLKQSIKTEEKTEIEKTSVNLQPADIRIPAPEPDSSKKLIKILDFIEQVNGFKFSNVEVKVLKPENSDGDVLHKKIYSADGITENYNFKVEFITLEYKNGIKVIPCGLLMSNDYDDEEIQDVFNRSKRIGSLQLLFDTLQLYAILTKKRNDILIDLIQKFPNIFEIYRDKDTGHFIINCASETQEYFECVWKIKWWSTLYSIMHLFNISVSFQDAEFIEQSSPLFETLCSMNEYSKEIDKKLNIWTNIGILVTHFESKKFIE